MESKKVNVKLTFNLNRDEVEAKAHEATRAMTDLQNMEEEFNIVKRDWNKKLKDSRLQVRKMCQVFAAKLEEREVEAEACYDLGSGKTWFNFQGGTYSERSISDEERQLLQQGSLFEDDNLPWTGTNN